MQVVVLLLQKIIFTNEMYTLTKKGPIREVGFNT